MLGRPTLSVQQTPEGSLLARWEPPADVAEDPVLGYRLQFGREDAAPATLELAAWERRFSAPAHKGATYVFRLAARGRAGLGEEAAAALSIPEDAPRGFPQILGAAGNASSGSVLLRWLPPVPAERNGAIVKYTVSVREAGSPGPATETELAAAAEPGAETALTLQGLRPETAYELRVRAHTRRGPGPFSPPLRYSLARDPGRRRPGPGPPLPAGKSRPLRTQPRRPRLRSAQVGCGSSATPWRPRPSRFSPQWRRLCSSRHWGQGRQGRARQEGRGHSAPQGRQGPPQGPLGSGSALTWSLFFLSPLAAACSLPQELQGENDHEDISAVELGVP